MTDRLYYTDSTLIEFEADVLTVSRLEDGRPAIVLDRTAFYPASGGQPFDTGALDAARVVDVLDREDGTILHVVEGPVPAGRVTGRVDWDRRFDHMQQHTGQHVLSAAFERLCGVRTLSFHLGAAAATIDLAREATAAEMAEVEHAANAVVWENRSVTVRFADASDAAELPLRKEPARAGRLRLVDVQDFDLSACGGTHVSRTGAIGLIAVTSSERFKGGSRVEFRCGGRALRAFRALRDTVAAGARLASAAPGELPQAIERLQAEARDLRRRVRDAEARLAGYKGEVLAAEAVDLGGAGRVVIDATSGADIDGLKAVAASITRRGVTAILSTGTSPASIVIARPPGAPLDAAALLKQLTTRFGGRGGGRPELAQGGGLEASPAAIAEAARALVQDPAAGG